MFFAYFWNVILLFPKCRCNIIVVLCQVINFFFHFRLAPFGAARRKDYSPVSWKKYFERYVDIETEEGSFRVYLSPEPDHPSMPRIITLHGGGYSGLSWSLFTVSFFYIDQCLFAI